MNTIIDGINTNYIKEGRGEKAALILPGWSATSSVYNLIIKQLSQDFTVYALDLPGFGITPEPAEPWSVDSYANFVISFIKAMGLDSITLIGHSYGGRIIINLCNRSLPFSISEILLIDSAGIKTPLTKGQQKKQNFLKSMKKIFQSKPLTALSPGAIEKLQNKFGSRDYAEASPIMKQTLVLSVMEDYTDKIPNISVPTLLIWGENDTSTPIADAHKMHSLIKGSALVTLPDAAHFPFLDQPFEFKKILREHFKLSE